MSYFILSLLLVFQMGEDPVQGCEDPASQNFEFVACVWSPSECYYSCPARLGYKAEVDPELCDLPPASWACYCATEG